MAKRARTPVAFSNEQKAGKKGKSSKTGSKENAGRRVARDTR